MNSDNLHVYILSVVKTEILKQFDNQPISDQRCFRILFKNYRSTSNKHYGLRLSYLGDKIMSKHFESYSYEMDSSISNKALLGLDKKMFWPYYIVKKHVTFYSQDDAAWFRLNGQDINTYTDLL